MLTPPQQRHQFANQARRTVQGRGSMPDQDNSDPFFRSHRTSLKCFWYTFSILDRISLARGWICRRSAGGMTGGRI